MAMKEELYTFLQTVDELERKWVYRPTLEITNSRSTSNKRIEQKAWNWYILQGIYFITSTINFLPLQKTSSSIEITLVN